MAVAPGLDSTRRRAGAVGVWLARGREGRLLPATHEALYEAGALARRLALPLAALTDVAPSQEEAALLARWGVGQVHALGTRLPPHPQMDAGRSPLAPLQPAIPWRVMVFPQDSFGQAVAPLWAAEAGAVLVTGATGLTSDGTHFVLARPTLGEQYEALVTVPLDTALVVTLQAGAIGEALAPPFQAQPSQAGAASLAHGAAPAAADWAGAPPHILPPDASTLSLEDAERIVAFGRGAFSREAVALVERLAALLGAVVAGSRPAADEGWLPFSRQVGLTGAIVRPRLYVAVGISGAPYHMVGIKDPELLIAINADPEAPIFGSAHLGLVGDLHRILPELIARLEAGQPLVAEQPAILARSSAG